MTKKQAFLALLLVLANLYVWTFVGCAGTARQDAIKAAQVSYVTYETLAPACAREIGVLTLIRRERNLTDPEKARLDGLIRLARVLDAYQKAHDLYVKSLNAHDRQDLKKLLDDAINLGVSLGLSFHAVRLSP